MKPVWIMGTPIDGSSTVIGPAPLVCLEVYGIVDSFLPRYINSVIRAAEGGLVFKGYRWQVLDNLRLVTTDPYNRNRFLELRGVQQ